MWVKKAFLMGPFPCCFYFRDDILHNTALELSTLLLSNDEEKITYCSWNTQIHLKKLFFHHVPAKLKLKVYQMKLSCATTCIHMCAYTCIYIHHRYFSAVKYHPSLHWKYKVISVAISSEIRASTQILSESTEIFPEHCPYFPISGIDVYKTYYVGISSLSFS